MSKLIPLTLANSRAVNLSVRWTSTINRSTKTNGSRDPHSTAAKGKSVNEFIQKVLKLKDIKSVAPESALYSVLSDIGAKHGLKDIKNKKTFANLQLLLLQKRISDGEISECLTKLDNHKEITNIVSPIHPNAKQPIKKKVIHVNLKPSTAKPNHNLDDDNIASGLARKSADQSKVAGKSTKGDIDIKALENYLDLIELREKQKQNMQNMTKRAYKWDEVTSNVGVSPGKMIFGSDINTTTKSNIKIRRMTNKIATVTGFLNKSKKRYKPILIYDLSSKETTNKLLGKNFNLFNVNHTDLFGIINAAHFPPEEILGLISKFEDDGWKLIGNIHDKEYCVVFQGDESKLIVDNKPNILIPTALMLVGFGSLYYYYVNYYDEEQSKVEEDN
ncbi:uncharacterized protein HLK63_G07139 [Nakaseomyces glabratus]|nr:hypothetical protein J6894_01934 [Nakaseomyces glabratus]KAJ9571485.1 hypothetical protein LTX96_0002033 [Nakaseomyces glabratus]OXB43451.1 hypothetical protein B1J91_G07447g [Nakaseomyces glabratus]OXB48750.1 hypothetical protein B1J92_G07447g [Nakaseomyces glabratus]QNG14017.1 uncharacterized protein GWK60_G07139 [Nakaseomyces glabratus]